MKIIELHVAGYRSLKDVTWKPGDLNLIIGPNGSGKTNLVQALALLGASARGELRKFVSAERGLVPMLWDGRAKEVSLRVRTSPSVPATYTRSEFDYSLTLGEPGVAFMLAPGPPTPYGIRERLLIEAIQEEEEENPTWQNLFDVAGPKVTARGKDGEPVEMEGRPDQGETLLSEARGYLWSVPQAPPLFGAFPLNMGLSRWTVYGFLDTGRDSPVRYPQEPRWEKTLLPDGENLITYLATLQEDRSFRESIDAAMGAAFDGAFDRLFFPPASDNRIQLRLHWKNLNKPMAAGDLSDGTLRFLFLIAVLANPLPPPLIVIEEPEIGLHPSMLSIIAEYAAAAAERTQVIFTTHSPDFLSAFREDIPTVTVCTLEGGETMLRVLKEDDLRYWLKEYSLGQFAFSGAAEAV